MELTVNNSKFQSDNNGANLAPSPQHQPTGSDSIFMMHCLFDVKKFIIDIYQRPALWHRTFITNRCYVEDTWDEMAELHNQPKKILKTKWDNMRNRFRTELCRIPRDNITGKWLVAPEEAGITWLHFKSLCFLLEHEQPRKPRKVADHDGPLDFSRNDSNTTSSATDADMSPPPPYQHRQVAANQNGFPERKPFQVMPRTTVRQAVKRPRRNGYAEDDDYCFLLSLHPYMARLDPQQKLRLRLLFQKSIFDELYKNKVGAGKELSGGH